MVNTTRSPSKWWEGGARASARADPAHDHIKSPKLGPLCQRVSYGLCQEYEPFLRLPVLEKNRAERARMACPFATAHFLQFRALIASRTLCRRKRKATCEGVRGLIWEGVLEVCFRAHAGEIDGRGREAS